MGVVLAMLLAQADPMIALRAAIAQREAAQARHDVDGLIALQAPASRLTAAGFERSGAEAIRGFFVQLFAKRPDVRMVRTTERVLPSSDGDTAVEQGRWRERWTDRAAPVELRGRYFITWRRMDGKWLQELEAFAPLSCIGRTYCTPANKRD